MSTEAKQKSRWPLILLLGCVLPAGIVAVAFVACVAFVGSSVNEAQREHLAEAQRVRETVSTGNAGAPQAGAIAASFYEVKQAVEGEDKTDMVKDTAWRDKYKGKIVQWEGEVVDVMEPQTLHIKIIPSTITWDVVVDLQPGERDKAMQTGKGDIVKFRGVLNGRGGVISSYRVENAVIVQ